MGSSTAYAATVNAAAVTDAELAAMVAAGLRDLARHAPSYVAVVGHGTGARLAAMLNTGLAATATPEGRSAMRRTYVRTQVALTLPPGLDGNELVDAVTGRRNSRKDRESMREATAYAEDRAALANP